MPRSLGTQRAKSVGHSTLRAYGHLDALALAGKYHCVFADDVTPADGMERDARAVALAGNALPTEHGDFLEIAPECSCNDLAEPQRRSGGRIHLVPVMCLDDLDVKTVAETARSDFRQLERDIYANGKVRRQDNPDRL